ncbi:outer membrane protein transport protein [Pseudoalteromonas luteoviolacea]|uniref:outer membrane protein transport protein n=1 Tax=Pseudoalteromonas luteoviolacea TaxID=43657 RepID=UPI001B399AB7|nr:outer membrane protein transport protein [Pseudoalteromonas luteoviolacea]MBQ4838404.1 outer membrane protein transport protein [Pseudoalteromonas luteoviolacea]
MNRIMVALLGAGAMITSTHSLAAAFQLAEQNVSGLGRAYAGEASVADDASVVSRNPALMSKLQGTQVSVAAMYVKPDVSLQGISTNNGVPASALDNNSIAPSATVPSAFVTTQLNDKWSLGGGMYSQFGLATEFDDNYVAGQIAGETEIVTINSGIAASYQVNDKWTLALGLNHVYADAKILRNLGANRLGISSNTEVVNLEGDDTGFGWNVGAVYNIDADNRFGFHYRSETDITFKGTFSNQLPAVAPFNGTAGRALSGSVAITLPAIAEVSGSHQLNKQTALHYSILWTGWNSFQTLAANVDNVGTVFSKDENFSNSLRYSIGTDHQWSEDLKLRAGFAYDESPADEHHMSISIPDTDRVWYSFGAEYQLSKVASVDIGVSIIRGKTQRFVEKDNSGSEWGFKSKGHASVFGLQYNHTL